MSLASRPTKGGGLRGDKSMQGTRCRLPDYRFVRCQGSTITSSSSSGCGPEGPVCTNYIGPMIYLSSGEAAETSRARTRCRRRYGLAYDLDGPDGTNIGRSASLKHCNEPLDSGVPPTNQDRKCLSPSNEYQTIRSLDGMCTMRTAAPFVLDCGRINARHLSRLGKQVPPTPKASGTPYVPHKRSLVIRCRHWMAS